MNLLGRKTSMSDIDEIKNALSLFNDKADKLFRLSFVKTMFETQTGVTLSWKAKEDGSYSEMHERRGPEEEAIDAFVLTFRYFIQDNEESSFRKMAGHYENLPLDISFKNQYDAMRAEVNTFLDSQPEFRLEHNSKGYSRREIMEVFIYGGLSHASPAKKAVYDVWMQSPLMRPLTENEFVYTIAAVFKAIEWTRELNASVLKELGGALSA
jgi:hypothetical protein